MNNRWYSINSVRPACPIGNVNIDYDPGKDVLLISLDDSIADDEMLIDAERDVVVTIKRLPGEAWCISSLALTNASKHRLWADLFGGLESGLRDRKKMNFSVDPIHWELK